MSLILVAKNESGNKQKAIPHNRSTNPKAK